jgi:hypothetical protein
MRRTASANNGATERVIMLGSRLWSGSGTVLVATISRIPGSCLSRSMAGPV